MIEKTEQKKENKKKKKGGTQGMEKREELQHKQDILNAISSVYQVIISANLAKNRYRMLEYQPLLSKEAMSIGLFDDLISMGLDNMEPEFQRKFLKAFSREEITKCFLSGQTEIYEEIKQICADGKEHWLGIHCICTSGKEDDLREICLIRMIDEKKEKERRWKRQLVTMNNTIQEQENTLRKALEYEKLANECMRLFYHVENLKDSVDRVMELTGRYFKVQRSFVCEIHNDRVFNTFEFCAKGIFSKKEYLQDMDIHFFDYWMPLFWQEKYVACPDIDALPSEAAEMKDFFKKLEIHQIILIPVCFDGEMRLFLGYDNPNLEEQNFLSMIDTLIGMAIVGIKQVYMERKRNILTYKDGLTNLWNRTRMNEDILIGEGKKESTGIIFLDVNGLKAVNDNCSHEAGDALLKAFTKVILTLFPESASDKEDWTERAYRIGGDEFILWLRKLSKQEFEQKKNRLQEMYLRAEDCSASIGGVYEEHAENIFAMIKEADHLMYEDKKKFYTMYGGKER